MQAIPAARAATDPDDDGFRRKSDAVPHAGDIIGVLQPATLAVVHLPVAVDELGAEKRRARFVENRGDGPVFPATEKKGNGREPAAEPAFPRPPAEGEDDRVPGMAGVERVEISHEGAPGDLVETRAFAQERAVVQRARDDFPFAVAFALQGDPTI